MYFIPLKISLSFSVLRGYEFVYKLCGLFMELLKTLKGSQRQIQSRQAGMWRNTADACLGGLAPSGEEAGDCLHKAALTFAFLIRHACVVVLVQGCYSSSATSSAGGSPTATGVLGALARAGTGRYLPRSRSERRRVRCKREGRSRAG